MTPFFSLYHLNGQQPFPKQGYAEQEPVQSGGAVSSGRRTQGWVAMGIACEHQSSTGSGWVEGQETVGQVESLDWKPRDKDSLFPASEREQEEPVSSHIWLLLILQITAERSVTSSERPDHPV